jgi:hypothetical protein
MIMAWHGVHWWDSRHHVVYDGLFFNSLLLPLSFNRFGFAVRSLFQLAIAALRRQDWAFTEDKADRIVRTHCGCKDLYIFPRVVH